ncbi:glycohydrolase toxin TNT-related protein [Bacillus nitratireducens]
MGFQVDLKEFNEVLAKLQKDTSKTNDQLDQAKNALNGIIQADAMQGETGKAIVNDINNNQNTVVIGLKDTNELLSIEMAQTLQDFQSTTGESDENAVILEDALLQAQNKLSNLQPKKHELDSRISNIYNSVSDLISLSMPNSQFDEKLVAASKELEDTIQKVQQFESKKEKSDAENILNALNNQVQIAGKMGSLSYTDPQLQAFFALDDLAKGIHEMDTQITKAKKEAQLQAEREMKKKQEEWADNHPVEAWLQNFSKSAGEKWDVLRKGTEWVGENIPFLKGLADDALVLEGFLGAAGSAISGIAIGATKLVHLVWELGEWGFNSIRGVETEQWKLDDISGAGNTLKNLGQAIISWQDYPKYGKALFNSVKGYVEKALTDPYALGGAIFDIGSCFVGVGEVTAAVKGTAAFGKFAEGTKVFQVAAKNSKIVGKLEEVMALMNKLPDSMKNVVEKIKNIEIPNLFPEPALAGIGGERKTLGELFSAVNNPRTRLPRNDGHWKGEPGNGKWYSDKTKVKSITNGEGVEFIDGRPNFTPWSKGSIKFKEGMLDGSKNDFNLVYEKIMQLKGFKSKNQGKAWLKEKGLTPHHKSSTEIELIPTDLHANVPHIGSASDLREGAVKAEQHVQKLLKQSTCTTDELHAYLNNIDSKLAEEFKKTGQWPEEVQIPKNSDVLRADGHIDWGQVPNGGYVVNKDGKVMKDEYTLKMGEVIDRYGPPNGTYTSPVVNGKPYSYGERALPYLEDVSKYHQYEVVGDFSNIKTYVDNCSDPTLKAQVDAAIQKYYCGDYSKLKAQIGEIAPGFGTIKGGTQIQLPLTVEQLEGLKLLKQIK